MKLLVDILKKITYLLLNLFYSIKFHFIKNGEMIPLNKGLFLRWSFYKNAKRTNKPAFFKMQDGEEVGRVIFPYAFKFPLNTPLSEAVEYFSNILEKHHQEHKVVAFLHKPAFLIKDSDGSLILSSYIALDNFIKIKNVSQKREPEDGFPYGFIAEGDYPVILKRNENMLDTFSVQDPADQQVNKLKKYTTYSIMNGLLNTVARVDTDIQQKNQLIEENLLISEGVLDLTDKKFSNLNMIGLRKLISDQFELSDKLGVELVAIKVDKKHAKDNNIREEVAFRGNKSITIDFV